MTRSTPARVRRHRNVFLAASFAAPLALSSAPAAAAPRTGPDPYASFLAQAARDQEPKLRIIYNDDAEIDGLTEFMRFLLYSNEFADSLIGIVYTSSEFHYRGDPSADPPIAPFGWSGGDLVAGQDRLETLARPAVTRRPTRT